MCGLIHSPQVPLTDPCVRQVRVSNGGSRGYKQLKHWVQGFQGSTSSTPHCLTNMHFIFYLKISIVWELVSITDQKRVILAGGWIKLYGGGSSFSFPATCFPTGITHNIVKQTKLLKCVLWFVHYHFYKLL